MKIENQKIKARILTVLKWIGAILLAFFVMAVILAIVVFFFTPDEC